MEDSCLARFSKFMRFPIEDYNDKILDLMYKIDARSKKGKGKRGQPSTKYDRELKKLEWMVKDRKSKRGDSGRGGSCSIDYEKVKNPLSKCEGANDPNKRRVIKAFLKKQKVDLVCLQETKMKGMSKGVFRSLRVGRFLDRAAISAEGASGGIVIFWDSRTLQLIGKEESLYSISCRLKNFEDNFQWVYGSTDGGCRELFWEDLGAIRSIWEDPSERNRKDRITRSMRKFSQVTDGDWV